MRPVRSLRTRQTALNTPSDVLAVCIISRRSVHRFGLMTTRASGATSSRQAQRSISSRTVGRGSLRSARRRMTVLFMMDLDLWIAVHYYAGSGIPHTPTPTPPGERKNRPDCAPDPSAETFERTTVEEVGQREEQRGELSNPIRTRTLPTRRW